MTPVEAIDTQLRERWTEREKAIQSGDVEWAFAANDAINRLIEQRIDATRPSVGDVE